MSSMKKPKEQTEWQRRNRDKVSGYTNKYLENKVKATVILTSDIAKKIDKIKPASQTYGRWVRELVENYVNDLEQI
jgi:hypothetical protein